MSKTQAAFCHLRLVLRGPKGSVSFVVVCWGIRPPHSWGSHTMEPAESPQELIAGTTGVLGAG